MKSLRREENMIGFATQLIMRKTDIYCLGENMILILSLLLGCGEPEQDMQCAAVCMAEHSYTYTKEMESYLLEASVSSSYGTESIRFEYAGTSEEVYGEASGVIMTLTATGFHATVEYELNIEEITINGDVVATEVTEHREKAECGGTCDAKSFSIANDDVSPLE